MDFWDRLRMGTKKIGKKSEELVSTAVVKSEELLESAKLRIAISKLETEIVKKKTELGTIVYQLYREKSENDGSVDKICEEIKRMEDEAAKLRKKLEKAEMAEEFSKEEKNGRGKVCPQCGEKIVAAANFCSNCGAKL